MATAIIGGTGIGYLLQTGGGEPVEAATQFGILYAVRRKDGIYVVARHGPGHGLPPHKVPYKSISAGLIALGVDRCLSSGAVGSLDPSLRPGDLAAVSDFIDLSGRNVTMFEQGVHHTDFSSAITPTILKKLLAAGADRSVVYACMNGPRYETPAEIRMLRAMGADVVGMTVATEAVVMREMGIEYGCLAIISNYAAGISDAELSHEEVVAEVNRAAAKAVQILLKAAR
jgi:5'-methylthioadenosine phosphorylase